MELLYLIDGLVTRLVQGLSKFAEYKLHFSKVNQKVLIWVCGLVIIYTNIFARNIADSGLRGLIVLIPLTYVEYNLAKVAVRVLIKLHEFFDPEMVAEDKTLGDGYEAWVKISTGSIFFAASYTTQPKAFVWAEIVISGGLLIVSVFRFLDRKGSSKTKKRKGATEALRKLVEKCRSWLPTPNAAPVPIKSG